MKSKLLLILLIYTLPVLAQKEKINFNYIEYDDSVRNELGQLTLSSNLRMWYNDKVSFQQEWLPMPKVALKPMEGATDSVTEQKFIEAAKINYYARKINTCKIPADRAGKKLYFDYLVIPGKMAAYYSNKVPTDSIVFVNDTTLKILGMRCKLAVFYDKNQEGSLDTAKIWYAPEINLPFGPKRYAQQLPGLIMKVDAGIHHYTARKIENPSLTEWNFDLQPGKKELYTYEEIKAMYARNAEAYRRKYGNK